MDLIDCSSGGNYSDQKIKLEKGYQVPLSKSIREGAEILTGTVGLKTSRGRWATEGIVPLSTTLDTNCKKLQFTVIRIITPDYTALSNQLCFNNILNTL